MKNFVIFPALSKVRKYQLNCALMLTSVPLFCTLTLTALLFFFAQLNLYYLENAGLIVSEQIRQAYYHQVEQEMIGVSWYVGVLVSLTFLASLVIMNWAVSPFINAERILRKSLDHPKAKRNETDWLSESPAFHHVVWGLSQRLADKTYAYDKIDEPTYKYNYRFMIKFVLSFYAVSLITGYILEIVLNTVYLKIVNLAISLVSLNDRSYYFIAQEELLRTGGYLMIVLSCIVYLLMGTGVTRYMSNMIFVFTRAVKEHHFPLKLRDSDIYHDLARTISDVAEKANLVRKQGTD
jgi:hypothetical protein